MTHFNSDMYYITWLATRHKNDNSSFKAVRDDTIQLPESDKVKFFAEHRGKENASFLQW